MKTIALRAREHADAPKLRLLPDGARAPAGPGDGQSAQEIADRPALRLVHDSSRDASRVLVAGENSAQRAAVLEELARTMPRGTMFEQAGAFWEVLVRAPSSRMVILSGDLDEVPAESLMQMLGSRHPGLPVVSLRAPAL